MNKSLRFADRAEAGRALAEMLKGHAGGDVVVLALPRGGVPVAFEVARALGAPLDVYLVRKLGVPGHEELAMGAIATGGVVVRNEDVIGALGVADSTIDEVAARERVELERRGRLYRDDRPPIDVAGKTVILIDDGLATGSSMRAAIAGLRRQGPARVIVAVPTSSPATRDEMLHVADDCVCVITPDPFHAVGLWYRDFSQTDDAEVSDLLARARGERENHPGTKMKDEG